MLNKLFYCFQYRLRNAGIPLKFVTNTTKESGNLLYGRLTKLGFDIKKEEIFSSLAAARKLIISRKLNPMLFIDPAANEDFDDLIRNDDKKDAVVIGLAPDKFNYEKLTQAFRYTLTILHDENSCTKLLFLFVIGNKLFIISDYY